MKFLGLFVYLLFYAAVVAGVDVVFGVKFAASVSNYVEFAHEFTVFFGGAMFGVIAMRLKL